MLLLVLLVLLWLPRSVTLFLVVAGNLQQVLLRLAPSPCPRSLPTVLCSRLGWGELFLLSALMLGDKRGGKTLDAALFAYMSTRACFSGVFNAFGFAAHVRTALAHAPTLLHVHP